MCVQLQARKVKDFEKLQRKQERAQEPKPAPKPRGRPRRDAAGASKPVDETDNEPAEGKRVEASKPRMYPYGCIIPNDTPFDRWDGFQGEPDSDMEKAGSCIVACVVSRTMAGFMTSESF